MSGKPEARRHGKANHEPGQGEPGEAVAAGSDKEPKGRGEQQSSTAELQAEYDLYINIKKPAVGIYVRAGTGLPDFADPKEWVFDGTATPDLLPSSVVRGVEANGHAFRDMD